MDFSAVWVLLLRDWAVPLGVAFRDTLLHGLYGAPGASAHLRVWNNIIGME